MWGHKAGLRCTFAAVSALRLIHALSTTSQPQLFSFAPYGISVYSSTLAMRLNCDDASSRGLKIEEESGLILQEASNGSGLELVWGPNCNEPHLKKESPFQINFVDAVAGPRMKKARSELICKAMGSNVKRGGIIFDLTAGLGRDSLVLACAGYHVVMVERNKVLYTLLQDALSRLEIANPSIASRLFVLNHDSANDMETLLMERNGIKETLKARRNTLKVTDGEDWGAENEEIAVYLDPIYKPKSVGKRAMVKKETQMLHRLVDQNEGDDEMNNKLLLGNAFKLATSRVVVKRALKAEPLGGIPSHDKLLGSTQRFDLYMSNRPMSGKL